MANKETEIKLRASRATLAALREHPLLNQGLDGAWQQGELFNQYYDSADRDLARARVALRVRRDGEHYIQTLKTRGQSVAGLSERNEWDWSLSSAQLDTQKLDDQCWPAALANLDRNALQPLFSTDFTREKANIVWEHDGQRLCLEAALDLGSVTAGERSEEICELELELRDGEPAQLLALAIQLATDLPLMPCDISKAERGYRLFNTASYSVALPMPELSAEQSLDDSVAALGWYLLGNSQRLAEQYRFSGHWKLLEEWVARLTEWRALLSSLGQAAPRASSRELRELLDALLNEWRPHLVAGHAEQSIRQATPTRFTEELENTRWGLFSLKASHWLLTRAWTQKRTGRGQKAGNMPLECWLSYFLNEEIGALPLERYQRQPADLPEQLPRLERMLVWLRLARTTLDIPEADRLYGELHKLYELALAPNDEETLAARAVQVQTVWMLRGWKALK